MTRLLLIIGLFALNVQLSGQTSSIVGLWKTPKGPAAIHYKFDSEGTMKYNFYGCLSSFQRTGYYTISKNSIFITYDSLTAEEKFIYQVKTTPPSRDTLFIVDRDKIKLKNGLFIYDRILANGRLAQRNNGQTVDTIKIAKSKVLNPVGIYVSIKLPKEVDSLTIVKEVDSLMIKDDSTFKFSWHWYYDKVYTEYIKGKWIVKEGQLLLFQVDSQSKNWTDLLPDFVLRMTTTNGKITSAIIKNTTGEMEPLKNDTLVKQ